MLMPGLVSAQPPSPKPPPSPHPHPHRPPPSSVYPKVTLLVPYPVVRTPVLEHTPIKQQFTLVVDAGVGGARPTYDLVVCTESGAQCAFFPQVTPPQSLLGSLTVDAPAAGQKRQITLVACVAARSNDSILSCGTLLDSESSPPIDVAMRVAVYFDSFTILHTRAHQHDTTYYALAGIQNGKPAPQPQQCSGNITTFVTSGYSIWCVGPLPFGDVDDGIHPLNEIKVGEFKWVPGRTNYLTFAFETINYGYGLPNATLDPIVDMRRMAMNHLLSKLTAPNAGVLEDFTPEINDLDGWRGCDGPTAAGAKRLFNFRDSSQSDPTVDELTSQTGSHTETSKEFVVPSQSACGGSSKYKVTWTLKRTSWRGY